jgi:hypothetical protein
MFSQLRAGHERRGGSVDPVDHDRLRRVAGADRRVSPYLHTHLLVESHGQPGWVAALTPLSVDGMIVAASTTLLTDSLAGKRGGVLPWALLAVGSVASLAANVTVAEPTAAGRVIATWPSLALISAYELLMRQVRRGAVRSGRPRHAKPALIQRQPGHRPLEAPDAGRLGGALNREAGIERDEQCVGARCCSGHVTCQWLRRWAELRRGEFARRSPGQQAGYAQSARDLISRLATGAVAGPRRAGT